MKLYVIKRKSTKTGKMYTALILNKDGKEYMLTFDKWTMLRLTNMTLVEFENIAEDTPIYI